MAAGLLGTGTQVQREVQREVVVYTHTHPDTAMVEVENTRTSVTPDQLRSWCQQAGTRVTVRPVLDLNENLSHRLLRGDRPAEGTGPAPPPDLRVPPLHPTITRHGHRPHPRVPHRSNHQPNLAPLCRRHHRLKTHTAWTYTRTGPRTFTWTSPHGCTYHVESDRHLR